MSNEINYKNNPLNGVGLKSLLAEIVDHYGFEILYGYLNINCFKTNPSIDSSVKFLKKTDWAREKVEDFYMYQFKSLPWASSEQFLLSPRDRVITDDQKPGEPAELSLDDAERLSQKRQQNAAEWNEDAGHRSGLNNDFGAQRRERSNHRDSNHRRDSPKSSSPSNTSDTPEDSKNDPWAGWKSKQ